MDYINIDLYYKWESKLPFRLPFGGHGILWKRLKIGPQELEEVPTIERGNKKYLQWASNVNALVREKYVNFKRS